MAAETVDDARDTPDDQDKGRVNREDRWKKGRWRGDKEEMAIEV